MTKEEIKKIIFELRPMILNEADLQDADERVMLNVIKSCQYLSYYRLLMKQQMISVILYMTGNKYNKVELFAAEYEDIFKLYLKTRNLLEIEFDEMIEMALADFDRSATENGEDAYLAFSRDEKIIASGVLVPEPLLSFEEIEALATSKRVEEITKEIAELEYDIVTTEEALKDCPNYMMRNELLNDITHNTVRIDKLNRELHELRRKLSNNGEFGGRR